MTYPEALQYLRDLEPRGWRLGLDRMTEFLRRAGLSDYLGAEPGPQFIHVAGTNGKGSVTSFVQSMLQAAAYRTGAFFSPYVVDPRERVWFGNEMISESDFTRAIERLRGVAEGLEDTEFGGVTEFEMKTAIGFEHWRNKKAEWVALEVGLGGRFDATNVVTSRAAVIVSIGLDHVSILGDTLGKIAFEKAGIVKPGIPVIVGDMAPEAQEVILRTARGQEAPAWSVGTEIRVSQKGPNAWNVETPLSSVTIQPSLYGGVQGHNAALAYAAMEASGAGSGQSIADAAQNAVIPGRFQVVEYAGRRFILDGAHNAEAAQALRNSLERYAHDNGYRRIVMISGMVGGHEPIGFYGALRGLIDEAHFGPIDFHRAVPPDTLVNSLQGLFPKALAHPSLSEAMEAAIASTADSDLILVTGSFYLVGDAIRWLGSALSSGNLTQPAS